MKINKTFAVIILTLVCLGDVHLSNGIIAVKATDEYAIDKLEISDIFNYKEYLDMYPELNTLTIDTNEKVVQNKLYEHFITTGLLEGRQPSKSFNIYAYKSAYSDLQLAFGNDIQKYYMHYINNGYYEGRDVTTIEKANSLGIVVTDFNNKVITSKGTSVVDSSAKVKHIFSSIKEINHNHEFKVQILKDDYTMKYCSCGSFQLNNIQ